MSDFNEARAALSPRALTFFFLLIITVAHTHTHTEHTHLRLDLTCVPELLVAVHGEDDQQVAQDVHHDGEDEKAAQSCGDPRRAVQDGVTRVRRGAVQEGPIYNHCTRPLNFFLPPDGAECDAPRLPLPAHPAVRASTARSSETPVSGYQSHPRLSSSSSSPTRAACFSAC